GMKTAKHTSTDEELGMRMPLTVGRWRLIRDNLTASMALTIADGIAGLLIAYVALHWFITTRQEMHRVDAIPIDGWVLAFVGGLVFLCAVFAGAASALSMNGDQILPALQQASRSHSAGQERVRMRKWLLS